MSKGKSEASWAPSSITLPNEETPGYRNEGCDDLEEGFGDSHEVVGATTGVSGEYIRTCSGGNSLGIRRRVEGMKKKKKKKKKKSPALNKIVDALNRLADACYRDSARGKKMAEEEAQATKMAKEARAKIMEEEEACANKMAEEARVKKMAEEEEARANEMAEEAHADEMSIAKVMNHLNQVDEVISDDDWYGRCTKLLMNPSAREMYVALKGRRELLLIFLKHTCYEN